MLTTHRALAGALFTRSHEVVNRLAIERDESGKAEYHLAKCDYQLKMNRISSRLPPTLPETHVVDEDDFSMYCSSNPESLCGTRTKFGDDGDGDGLDCSEIHKALCALASRRQQKDAEGGPLWKQQSKKPMDVFLRREALARRDVMDVEQEFYQKLMEPFSRKSVGCLLKLVNEEKRERKFIEDTWMSESLPFLDRCSNEQVEFIEEFWLRSLGKAKRAPRSAEPRPSQMMFVELDVRLCVPLLHRCETIRRETEAEEEIAFLYLRLGEAAQRDLVEGGIMCRNGDAKLLDSVRHPVNFRDYDKVDFAFHTEFRYLVSEEETQRMAIIDAAVAEMDELRMGSDDGSVAGAQSSVA